jgi:excisionase family DNA binding protein
MGKVSDFCVNGSGQALTAMNMTKETMMKNVSNSAGGSLPKTALAASALRKVRRARQPLPSFYTIAQVAEALDVSTRTVRRWIAGGALAVHRRTGVVRIAERDLLGFLAIHRKG